ncbi:bile acid:sodium symporter [Formicincola oecophyllae]|uniref:Bile acid:sodium symporter n=1 Tax=Formicincola oecophyllae TaxID=2558361 RepID=A0A4Y6UAQ7_9PROT|nr:bile acid:sodium symporter family protein [Formicincola oecophyllae]QDH13537.1 bile acid:sodium symporter [Formicincola oecophyllae]
MKRPDPFLSALIGAVLLATFLPCPHAYQGALNHLTSLLIMFMFFFQGAKLQRSALWESLRDWKVQGCALLATFVVFPLIGVALYGLCHVAGMLPYLTPKLWTGLLFVCCLPSTVQSSIALTSIARGNVPAAICAATVSNIVGIFATPLLVALLLPAGAQAGGSAGGLQTIIDIARELLLPFVAGQAVQPWLGPIVRKHKILLKFTDQGSIIVMVYAAFSTAVLEGLWHRVPWQDFVLVALFCTVLLAIMLTLTDLAGRAMGLPRGDIIALQFCGSKKSLSTGIPMASVIFPHGAGVVELPLLIYHQIQLYVGATLARHYARKLARKEGAQAKPQP